jgi:hypothetical protein
MATRSAIAIETGLPEFGPGVIHAVYCHWDGYVTNNGALLLEHFNSLRIASELIKGGSISSLGEGLNKTQFHCRDMGREMVPASEYGTREEFIEDSNGLEYLYILNQSDAWEVFDMDKPWRGWQLVKDALEYELKLAKAA